MFSCKTIFIFDLLLWVVLTTAKYFAYCMENRADWKNSCAARMSPEVVVED